MGHELKVKASMDLERAAAYLVELAASMSAGTVVVQKGGDHIVLKPSSPAWVEVEAEVGKTKETLAVEISWARMGMATEQGTDELIISSEVPVEEVEEEVEEETSDEAAEEYEALEDEQV